MFTGIIEGIGFLKKFTRKREDAVLDIETKMTLDDLKIGDSISVNGACLTLTSKKDMCFTADVSAETLARTNIKTLKPKDRVNLEKALRLNSFIGGHLVLGHVDGIGKIIELTNKSNSIVIGIEIDADINRYIVEKGSIAVDGVSLTVNRCEKNRFYVNMIPHTARMTTLGSKKVSDLVNIETDIIGKYVEKLINPNKGIDLRFLVEHGYIK